MKTQISKWVCLWSLVLVAFTGCKTAPQKPAPASATAVAPGETNTSVLPPPAMALESFTALKPPSVAAAKKFVYGGKPTGNFPLTILTNSCYLVGYDETLKAPRWVAYRLFKIADVWVEVKAPSRAGLDFKTDNRTAAKVTDNDLDGIGDGVPGDATKYDRGHMAPNASIANCYGTNAQKETFELSNVTIQKDSLNGQTWAHLESEEAEGFANFYTNVWIIDGPIFSQNPEVYGPAKIAIPTAFYKILVVETGGKPQVEAVIMDQQVKGTLSANPGISTTVQDIEQKTGLSFFKSLSASIRAKLETANTVLSLPPKP